MRVGKSVLSVFLSIVLVVGLCPGLAYADEGIGSAGGGEGESLVAGVMAAGKDAEKCAVDAMNTQALQMLEADRLRVVQIACGYAHSAAITSDGSLWMWGCNECGQLGTGDTVNRYTPTKILENVSKVSLGYEHSAAIKHDGSLWTWGSNSNGKLGDGKGGTSADGESSDRDHPVKVLDDVKDVSLGMNNTAAIKNDGSLWILGFRVAYEMNSDGRYSLRHSNVKVMDEVSGVAVGYSFAAVKEDGSLWTWGVNDHGQLGDGTTEYRSYENPCMALSGVSSVMACDSSFMAIKADGSLWAWGGNQYGKLGNGAGRNDLYSDSHDGDCPTPMKVMDGVLQASLGYTHAAAVTDDNSLLLWGCAHNGALGDGEWRSSLNDPGKPSSKAMDNVSAVSLGSSYTAALKSDNSLWTWGTNGNGQLGNNSKNATITDIGYALNFSPSPNCIFLDGTWLYGSNDAVSSDEQGDASHDYSDYSNSEGNDETDDQTGGGNKADDDFATSGTCGTCSWSVDAAGLLSINPTDGDSGVLDEWDWRPPWNACLEHEAVSSVVVRGSVKARTCDYMFGTDYKGGLKSVDLRGLDTSEVTSMDAMFFGDYELASLDVSGLDTSKVASMIDMFYTCWNLRDIDISSFDTSSVTDMRGMFADDDYDYLSLNSITLGPKTRLLDGCSLIDGTWRLDGGTAVYGTSELISLSGTPAAAGRWVREGRTDLAKVALSVSPATAVYNGSPQEPDVVVAGTGEVLRKGVDYTASYSGNVGAGTAVMDITGIGKYEGTARVEFTIAPAPLDGAKVSGLDGVVYTGGAVTPSPRVELDGRLLVGGVDYETAYRDNAGVGTGRVTVTGRGNYTGSVEATFAIAAAPASTSVDTPVPAASSSSSSSSSSSAAAPSAPAAAPTASAKSANTLKAKAKAVTLKARKLKKKAQSVKASKAFKVTGAKGKATYKVSKYDKKAKKKLTVSKSGKVTAKKGLPKGTYKLKVKVTASGDATHASAAKTVTLKVKVK